MNYPNIFIEIIEIFASIFDIAGIFLVAISGISALIKLAKLELKSFGHEKNKIFNELRVEFGQKIILGLEFFLAGDIMRIIITPTWDGIGRIAAIVVIRTILSYFLHKEIHIDIAFQNRT